MKHIYSLFSILFAALLMAGCVNDPDIDGGIRNAKKPSVKTDEILKSTASSVTVSGEGESKYIKPHCRRAFFIKKDIFVWFYKEYIINYMRKKDTL